MDETRFLNMNELAEQLDVSLSWIRRYSRKGCPKQLKIPSVRLGKYMRFHLPSVLGWIMEKQKIK